MSHINNIVFFFLGIFKFTKNLSNTHSQITRRRNSEEEDEEGMGVEKEEEK